MTWLLVVVVIGGILLTLAVLIFDLWETHKSHKKMEEWESIVGDFLDAFDEIKGVINVNAKALDIIRTTSDEHDTTLKLFTVLLDIHSQALNLDPNLRKTLEEKTLAHLDIQGLITEDQ